MAVAILTARRSPDPNTQTGACIANKEKKIASVGFSDMPDRCKDVGFPWNRESKNPLETKYPYLCHAVM